MMLESLLIPTKEELTAELCKRSLFYFVREFWHEIISDKPIWNWHIKYICEEFQKATTTVIEDEPKMYDLLLNICPATTKSTITSIMLPVWLWVNKPDCVTLCNTISSTNALKFAQKRRDILTSKKFLSYFPDITLRKDSTALSTLKNEYGGEITQYTTKGRITGDHGHIRIDDDPMSYTDAISDSESKRCIEGFRAYASRNKDIEKTVYILVMQRLSQIDTTAYAMGALTNYKHIVLPAVVNEHVKPEELSEFYTDGYLDPIRLGEESLRRIKKGLSGDDEDPMSDSAFNSQYLQDVENAEGLMYSEIKELRFDESLFDNTNDVYCAIDPADDGLDTLGVIYATELGGKYYVRDVIYNADDSDINLPKMVVNHERLRPINTVVETNGMGSVFGKRLKEHGVNGLKSLNNAENKIGRIDAYKWVVEDFFLFDSENSNPEYRLFIKHLKKLPKEGNKKMVGAADVCTHLAKFLFKTSRIK